MYRIDGKKAVSVFLATAMLTMTVTACGATPEEPAATETSESIFEEATQEVSVEEPVAEEPAAEEPYVLPEGMYFSETTGEPISEDIKDQRPIAAMVDNESIALPHFGTSEADVVYELMNSTKNDRITRLMCVVKDWGAIEQLGSIRSTRPTNILLASEWNAILCHDGGPYHNDAYFAKDWAKDHLSGVFSRVDNGKKREFTEYILNGDLESNLDKYGISATYNEFANEGSHFNFTEYGGKEIQLDEKYSRSYQAFKISLPFTHNGSQLIYNDEDNVYEYYEYGDRHEDAEDDAPLAFKNVFLQSCSFNQLDDEGYLIYNCIGSGNAWYITNGVAKDITWFKSSETDVTRFYDENGEEMEINTGKTYIGLIPEDTWDKVIFE
ncbi:DUF3048 domain-containing protein [Butyrivibrio sp. CB08]|uniref:DUF3048 domain-containing protein n=1 Tax=Butyrivibrio sp. CB08 TaxID=2364879 RepID=UPI000EAA84BE|nr:DUF3048 domain-containing protein [Butyrivibrio sp. CB08]RKM61466.1 DUF3048 domain-containing protein [Butyrivibrio sp. CB08]